jgi:phosphate transport system permease protein
VSAPDLTALQRSDGRLRRRRVVNRGMELLAWLAAAIAVAILVLVVWSVGKKGAGALNLDLFTKTPSELAGFVPNVKQGLANAFLGTGVIVAIAAAIALPIGILVAIYVNEFAPRPVRNGVTLVLDVLNGIPAIVIGIFVYGLIVLRYGQSGLAGAFALSVLMLPLVARSTIEVLALVPDSLREASLGLGVPRWRTTVGIVLPQTVGGVVTGAVLAVARVAGETAPLLFTSSLVGNSIAWNPSKPLASVPLAIFELSESDSAANHALAWAGALVLLMFILLTSLTARWLANRSRRKLTGASR